LPYSTAVDHLREKIGRLFLVGVQGETLAAEERLLFEEYGFGGFLLFKRNCGEAGQIVSLCRALWDLADEWPPFIAIDQEGGRVHRLPPPFTHFPPAARLGEKNVATLAYRAGRAVAAELALAGINLNFAPVLDVNSNPDNPVIGDRAFGANPQAVIKTGWPWTEGLRDGGIIPCGKHFPGHGATDKDSHFELPLVAKTMDELKLTELPPFVHACRNNIEALMTAHVLFPGLDPQWPATLSGKIVTGLLRQQLGYGGVVFSDDMEMKAISGRYGAEEAALLAIRAGVDILIFCHDQPRAAQACECLCAESEKDATLRQRVDESYARIVRLKRNYLNSFAGCAESELAQRLARLDHGPLAAKNYGTL
jgi:beta-N-acetylhexosaminidase